MTNFCLENCDGQARCGVLQTHHGVVHTPAFQPVATLGAIKGGVEPSELRALGAEIVLANTYHLSLRPGEKTVQATGDLPKFTSWHGPMLTDSGGFQVFSLANLRGIDADGVTFHSHLDGAELRFTPERATQIQNDLGSSIAMCFDVCTQMDAPRAEVEDAVCKTTIWAERCRKAHQNPHQLLFGIVQGALVPELCERSAREIVSLDFDGYALGGLANGLPIADSTRALTNEAIELRIPFLPTDQPRYLMGLGTPADILDGVARGIDLFDCVLPARMARHGVLYTSFGQYRAKLARHKEDFQAVDPACDCPLCRQGAGYSRAYLRHLFSVNEDLARRLSTLHNLRFYLRLMQETRVAISSGRFAEFHTEQFRKWGVAPANQLQ